MKPVIAAVSAAAVLAGLFLSPAARGAEDLSQNATVMLTLHDGVAPRAEGQREGKDMELDLTLKDGKFLGDVMGYAVWFNRADHEGTLTQQGNTLQVSLTVKPDKWFPKSPGEASYTIDLKREGNHFTGTYTGSFEVPDKDGTGKAKQEVKGDVSGDAFPIWHEAPAGFKKLEPNEHPRLIFRKADLPAIRKRMETPEGQAIMARFKAQLPKNDAKNTKNQPMYPAGYALAYQLTGDKAYATKAKELLEPMLNLAGRQDIHYGPMALGIALTLDMCYDAWDQDFRTKVIKNLAQRTTDLFTGTNIGTFAPNPWHNHNGVRAPSTGVAALCLLGEKNSDGKDVLPNAEHMIRILARDTRRYFEFNGTSRTGWCLEGAFYKRMTWNSGPGHFVHAYRTALGANILAGYPDAREGASATLPEWLEYSRGDRLAASFDLGDQQSSGLWPLGMAITPEALKPGAKWLYDHAYGLEGNHTFGIHWAYEAGYVLAAYPFDVAAKPPAEALPWAWPDATGGHYLFRRPWKGADDTLLVLHARSTITPGCHYERSGKTMDMQLFALGKQWMGPAKMSEDQGAGSALPAISADGGNADAPAKGGKKGAAKGASGAPIGNDFLGATTTYYAEPKDGQAILSLNMDGPYFGQLARGEAAPAGAKLVPSPRGGTFADKGIRASRYMALDTTGASGAPVLLVIIDKTEGGTVTWNLGLARDAGSPKIDGNVVTLGDPGVACMKGTFVAPAGVTLAGGLSATGGKEFFTIWTVQSGQAPAVKVEGEGLSAKVSVGGQTVRFDGQKVILGQ